MMISLVVTFYFFTTCRMARIVFSPQCRHTDTQNVRSHEHIFAVLTKCNKLTIISFFMIINET